MLNMLFTAAGLREDRIGGDESHLIVEGEIEIRDVSLVLYRFRGRRRFRIGKVGASEPGRVRVSGAVLTSP